MPFRCLFEFNWQATSLERKSPLIFATRGEANLFARKMFEEPKSVRSWKIEETAEKANYKYSDGRLKPL